MKKQLIIALDFSDINQAKELVKNVIGLPVIYKIGYQLFPVGGKELCQDLASKGESVFIDLKYHDIGATIRGGVKSIKHLGANFLTVHAQGSCIENAVTAVNEINKEISMTNELNILGVTVLTDLSEEYIKSEFNISAADLVLRRAKNALSQGAHGLVASAKEASLLREKFGNDFYLITPGIRREKDAKGDQKRITTPKDAIKAGSSHIVMGRPITQSNDPKREVNEILDEIS